MKKVEKNSPLPRYYQLKEILRLMIDNEELKPDEPIPTERELCEYHGISRMTARKAVEDLVHEGLLYREQGRGTFVSKPKENRNVSQLLSFTEEMKKKGVKVETFILSFELTVPKKKISKILRLKKENEKVYIIKRLRIMSDDPLAIETAYIPERILPGLKEEDIRGGSLYDIMEKRYNISMSYAKQSLEPVILTVYEGDLLRVKEEGMLGLLFERTTYDLNEEVIEYTKSIYRSDKYKFEITLKREW